IISSAVTYKDVAGTHVCNEMCEIELNNSTLAVCNDSNGFDQGLIDSWRLSGKRVMLSFGGAGMGGSWPGDETNCWDYCFGKEEYLANQLVDIVSAQNLDGVDVNYEYCYDVENKQIDLCLEQRRLGLYSDAKAQTFLNTLTSKLRVKLNLLQESNGHAYELTHTVRDSDLEFDSEYYRILKERRDDLDFITSMFFNGITNPVQDGVAGIADGKVSAITIYENLITDLFSNEAKKVVFGFCIDECGAWSATNIDAKYILQDLKGFDDRFACNGGASFWASKDDVEGEWSDVVSQELSKTEGCSSPTSSSSTTVPNSPTSTTTSSTTSINTTTSTTTPANNTTTTLPANTTTTTTTTTTATTTTPNTTTTTTSPNTTSTTTTTVTPNTTTTSTSSSGSPSTTTTTGTTLPSTNSTNATSTTTSTSTSSTSSTTNTSSTTTTTTTTSASAIATNDSRLIANFFTSGIDVCPTEEELAEQFDAYTHVLIASAGSYIPNESRCHEECRVNTIEPNIVAICENSNQQDMIDEWRSAGKKVLLNFGGALMGSKYDDSSSNCWDYCFGKEESLATQLVEIVSSQHIDGISIDYGYCYEKDQNSQRGMCQQASDLYSDTKAQQFLDTLTSKLRSKLDALGQANGQTYELTHNVMEIDLLSESEYYRILKDRSSDLDFLIAQFYYGLSRAVSDGVNGTGVGIISAVSIYESLAVNLFDNEPEKVVYGFCIDSCGNYNANGTQAIKIVQDLKSYQNGLFSCNGGVSFWSTKDDVNGIWSDMVSIETSSTTGCSVQFTSTTTTSSTSTQSTPTATQSTYNYWRPVWVNDDYNQGYCSNKVFAVLGIPTHETKEECCSTWFGSQSSGKCTGVVATTTTTPVSTTSPRTPGYDYWRPVWKNDFDQGYCSNQVFAGHGIPTYDTKEECCTSWFHLQSSGVCLSYTPPIATTIATVSSTSVTTSASTSTTTSTTTTTTTTPRRTTTSTSSSTTASSSSSASAPGLGACYDDYIGGAIYEAGEKVTVDTTTYECKAYPLSLYCKDPSFKPGEPSGYWKHAWIKVENCNRSLDRVIDTSDRDPSKNLGDCPEEIRVGNYYVEGDRVSKDEIVYECRAWPYSGFCGEVGYEPQSKVYGDAWKQAWMEVGWCTSYHSLTHRTPTTTTTTTTSSQTTTTSSSSASVSALGACYADYLGGKAYQAGDKVTVDTITYECKAYPLSLYCKDWSFKPGETSGYWKHAWIKISSCDRSLDRIVD
ncbi:hypothetical protein ACHAXS_005171, partial [Conticribra weissflogii]